MKVFWSGFPGNSGGANTECWHTAKMLRANGVDLTFIPMGGADLTWREKLEGIGCKVHLANWDEIETVPDLKGAVVISMCNSNFIAQAHRFRDMGCPIVWVNCMTFCYGPEIAHCKKYNKTFEAYVFQSDWQRKQIEEKLTPLGYKPDQGHLIRGAFSVDEFPYNPRPRTPNDMYCVGRLSRAAGDKYSSNTWPILKLIHRWHNGKMKARVMAWSDAVKNKVGTPPAFAECLASCAEPSQKFLGSLHCLLQVNGGAGENWPRAGLEAMASGVPIVAQNQWGWREMIRHGETGYLSADEPADLAFYAAMLGYDETLRLKITKRARAYVADELANPAKIWPHWEKMLGGLQC